MPEYPSTAPAGGDELGDSFAKINQILVTGSVGPTSTMFADAAPIGGDTAPISAQKINQIIHNRGGV